MASREDRSDHPGVRVNGFDNIPRPFIIGVGGGTASGKSTVCNKIMEQLGQDENQMDTNQKQVVIIHMDNFYRPLTPEEQERAPKGLYNFDHPGVISSGHHPAAYDDELLFHTLRDLKAGKIVRIPLYDPITCSRRTDSYQTIHPADVLLFEGILAFYFKNICDLFNMKLFVDTDADTRLSRRVMRDMSERGRDLDQILHHYTTFVKPAFEEFCLPTKKYADVIIPRGADNTVAIDLIVQHIQDLLKPKKNGGMRRVRHSSDSLMTFKYSPPH